MARLLAVTRAAVLFGLPAGAFALGLGDIKLNSALNQPLDAEIAIVSSTPAELRDLTASVAPRETFARYSLDYPAFLGDLRFSVTTAADGRPVLRMTSRQSITEPFVTVLVEADWQRGRLLREYTVLLDPPTFLAGEGSPAVPVPVQEALGARSQPSPESGAITRPAPPPPPVPMVAEPVARPEPAYTPPAPIVEAGSTLGPVRRGDTLWNIASRVRPDSSITMNQMMMALFRANPEAFLGNINLVKEGAVLRVPTRDEVFSIGTGEAYAAVRAQTAAWRGETATSAGASRAAASSASSASSDAGEAGSLRLVTPADGGAGTAETGGGAEAAALGEDLARAQGENATLSADNDSLKAQLEEARRLIEVRDAELARVQQQLAQGADGAAAPATDVTGTAAQAVTGGLEEAQAFVDETVAGADTAETSTAEALAEGTVAGSMPEAEQPDVAAPTTASPVSAAVEDAPAPGIFGTLLALLKSTWLWLALGLVAFLGAAVIALRGRREAGQAAEALEALAREPAGAEALAGEAKDQFQYPRADADEPAPAGQSVDEVEPELPSFDETGTFMPVDYQPGEEEPDETAEYPFEDTMTGTAALNLKQADALSEADFHMAYGLYDQAADLVKSAVEREPERRDLQLKLLEIYFVWGNKDSFLDRATALRTSMGGAPDGDWDKIVIMGRQICPDASLFSGEFTPSGGDAGVDLDLEASGETAVLLDTGETPQTTGASEAVDLDIGDALAANLDAGTSGTGVASETVGTDFGMDLADPTMQFRAPDDAEAQIEPVEAPAADVDGEPTFTASLGAEDFGLDLDLGQTITPEPTAEHAALAAPDADADDNDEVFGDFFAFAEEGAEGDSETGTATGAEAGDGETLVGDLLPESPTSEFLIDLPTEEGAVDLDLGDVAQDDPTGEMATRPDLMSVSATGVMEMDGPGNSATVPSAQLSETDLPDFGEIDMDLAGFADQEETVVDAEAMTIQSPMADDDATDLFTSMAQPDSAEVVDLDVGDAPEPETEERATTVKVSAAELALPETDEGALDEIGTKLDLARAYIDMGDPDGAKSILQEVMDEGDDGQKQNAEELLGSIA